MTLLLACDWLLETRMLSWQEECKKMPTGYVNLEFSNLKSFQEDLTSLRKIAQFVPVRHLLQLDFILLYFYLKKNVVLNIYIRYFISISTQGKFSY